MKNKHNTMNSDSTKSIIVKMNDYTKKPQYREAIPVVVMIVKTAYSSTDELLQLWSVRSGVRFLSGRIF